MLLKYTQLFLSGILFISFNCEAEQKLVEQISSLRSEVTFINQIKNIKQSEQHQLVKKINNLVRVAKDDLANATDEKVSIQLHLQALLKIQQSFDSYDSFQNFELLNIDEFLLDDEECVIADASLTSFQDFDCDQTYQYAINIWKRTLLAQRILLRWKKQARVTGLQRIQQSEKRWLNFSKEVTADQFPWETIVNGWLIKGSIATPPNYQLRLIHPVLVLSYADESDKYNQEMGVEIIGYRKYSKQSYQPEWGVSLFSLLESDTSENSGYGLMFSKSNFMFGVVRQDTVFEQDDTKYLIGYNLAKLFNNKKNELAKRKLELINRADQYKQKVDSLKNSF